MLIGGVIVGHLFIKYTDHLDASNNSELDNIGAGWYPVPEGEIFTKSPLCDLMLTLGWKRGFRTRPWGVSLEDIVGEELDFVAERRYVILDDRCRDYWSNP